MVRLRFIPPVILLLASLGIGVWSYPRYWQNDIETLVTGPHSFIGKQVTLNLIGGRRPDFSVVKSVSDDGGGTDVPPEMPPQVFLMSYDNCLVAVTPFAAEELKETPLGEAQGKLESGEVSPGSRYLMLRLCGVKVVDLLQVRLFPSKQEVIVPLLGAPTAESLFACEWVRHNYVNSWHGMPFRNMAAPE